MAEKATQQGFGALMRELRDRTLKPRNDPVFWFYMLSFVVGLGALGFWIEGAKLLLPGLTPKNAENLYTALITFFPPIIGTACAQILFETKYKGLQSFALFCLVLLSFLAAGLLAYGHNSVWAWVGAAGSTIFSLWFWWIANAHNEALREDPVPTDAAVGGDPDRELMNAGRAPDDLSELKV
jgi:hypothetical protein